MKTTKAELIAQLAKLEAENAALKKAPRTRLPQPDDVVMFPKRDGANPKAPDFQGFFITEEGVKKSIAIWWNQSRKALTGKVSDPVAREVERAAEADPSFIPSVDGA